MLEDASRQTCYILPRSDAYIFTRWAARNFNILTSSVIRLRRLIYTRTSLPSHRPYKCHFRRHAAYYYFWVAHVFNIFVASHASLTASMRGHRVWSASITRQQNAQQGHISQIYYFKNENYCAVVSPPLNACAANAIKEYGQKYVYNASMLSFARMIHTCAHARLFLDGHSIFNIFIQARQECQNASASA